MTAKNARFRKYTGFFLMVLGVWAAATFLKGRLAAYPTGILTYFCINAV